MGKREEIAVLFPGTLREFIESCSLDFESMREIRLRANRPVLLMYGNREYGFTEKGEPVELEPDNQKGLFTLTERQIRETAEIMGGFSLYAAQEELRQGFFTVRGGHRIGVAGRTVLNQREVGVLKSISSLNVRVAHEVKGCADQIMPLLCENGLFFKYGNRIAAGMRKNDPSSGHHPSAVQRLSGEKHGKASLWNHSRRGG